MIATALLVRWADGWHEVTNPAGIAATGRKEATLGLGAVSSLDEVTTVATEQLRIFSDPRTEIAADVDPPTDADAPFVAYRTADSIVVPDMPPKPASSQRVQAITATMDENGRVTYAVELRDVLLDERERFTETLTKMANGTLDGWSRVAQPVSYSTVEQPPYHPAPVGTWRLGTNTLDVWHAWLGDRSEHWVADMAFTPMTITVEGEHISGNPMRVALVRSGEGPEPIGTVVLYRGGTVTESMGSVTVPAGQEIWFQTQQWDEGLGDGQYNNLRVTVQAAGAHPDLTLPWEPPPS